MSEEKSIVQEIAKIELKENEIDLSGDGRVSKVVLKEGEGNETPEGIVFALFGRGLEILIFCMLFDRWMSCFFALHREIDRWDPV